MIKIGSGGLIVDLGQEDNSMFGEWINSQDNYTHFFTYSCLDIQNSFGASYLLLFKT